MAKIQQHFSQLPVPDDDDLKKKPIEELCKYYLDKLEVLIDGAKKVFLDEETQNVGDIRLPSYMRVIK